MDYSDYDNPQWDVDRVKLEFKSVKDLFSLLENRDLELYRETAEIHSELRRELNSIPTEISQSPHHLLSSSTVLASIPPSTSSKVSSQISAKNISNSTISENMLKILDSLCVDNCHMMLLASLLISVIFIISVFSIIILCRRKHNYNIKSRNGKSQTIQSSYIKSSISLDDIPAAPCQDQVSVLHNSPFYSPVRSSASPSLSPLTAFSTFHPVAQSQPPPPPFAQVRTSPEGSSASDQDIERTSAQDYGLGSSPSLSLSKYSAIRTINSPENQQMEEIYAKVNKFKPTKNNNCETNINCRSPDKDPVSNTSECLI